MSRTAADGPAARPSLTNPHADRVKAVRALGTRSGRRRSGRYAVEGPQAVREVVRWAPHTVRDVYLTAEAADRYAEIVADADAARLHVHLGDAAVLDAMSPDAQGVLAVADLPEAARPATRDAAPVGPLGADALAAVLAARPRLVAVLAQVRDPGNAGTVIRVADAAGADAVVVAGDSVETTNPKVVRSTAGSLFHLPVVSGVSVGDAVDALRAAGLAVLAADGTGDLDLDDLQDAAAVAGTDAGAAAGAGASTGAGAAAGAGAAQAQPGDAAPADLRVRTAWLFGNEAWGLPPEDRDRADAVVRVPLRGRAESLNLGTAAAVCLYASSRAHR